MYTKEDLIKCLKDMGLKSTDALMVHSSMKSIGPVEDGADTVVDAFMEYLKDGLFMTPTHTWAQMSHEYSVFDPATEPACVGIIPNIFRQREGVLRSPASHSQYCGLWKDCGRVHKGRRKCLLPVSAGRVLGSVTGH